MTGLQKHSQDVNAEVGSLLRPCAVCQPARQCASYPAAPAEVFCRDNLPDMLRCTDCCMHHLVSRTEPYIWVICVLHLWPCIPAGIRPAKGSCVHFISFAACKRPAAPHSSQSASLSKLDSEVQRAEC